MAKVAYIIPGYRQSTDMLGYQAAKQAFESRGFKTVEISIDWKYHVMSDYVAEFQSKLVHAPDDEVALFGFSFGAFIAFLSAEFVKPEYLILASLSPYFAEDINKIPKSWKKDLGINRMKDFAQISFDKSVTNIDCKATIIAGEKEPERLLIRSDYANKKIASSELITIPDTRHTIESQSYADTVSKVINKLITN